MEFDSYHYLLEVLQHGSSKPNHEEHNDRDEIRSFNLDSGEHNCI